MAATKNVIHISDLREDPAYLEEPAPQIVAAVEIGGVRTMLAVPMLKETRLSVRSRCTGKRFVLSPTSRSSWSELRRPGRHRHRERALLTELRARTDELARSVEELRALGETSQAVNSTLDLEMVLNTIVSKAVQLSGTEAGAIYVFDAAPREFRLRATYGMDQALITALGAPTSASTSKISRWCWPIASRFRSPILASRALARR
jgi:hypothetical protein